MNAEELAELTPEEKDKRIGQLIGARPRLRFVVSNDGGKTSALSCDTEHEAEDFLKDSIRRIPNTWLRDHQVVTIQDWPRYTGDLNAMHEAEKVLDKIQRRKFARIVYDNEKQSEFGAIHAPAAQRADAFLLTLN
jgi:hypothetical protein